MLSDIISFVYFTAPHIEILSDSAKHVEYKSALNLTCVVDAVASEDSGGQGWPKMVWYKNGHVSKQTNANFYWGHMSVVVFENIFFAWQAQNWKYLLVWEISRDLQQILLDRFSWFWKQQKNQGNRFFESKALIFHSRSSCDHIVLLYLETWKKRNIKKSDLNSCLDVFNSTEERMRLSLILSWLMRLSGIDSPVIGNCMLWSSK